MAVTIAVDVSFFPLYTDTRLLVLLSFLRLVGSSKLRRCVVLCELTGLDEGPKMQQAIRKRIK